MEQKAQAGLEYLMTYGWALVIIITVVGVLFTVIGSPQNKFTCTSSDPTKIIVESYNLPYNASYASFCNSATDECNTWYPGEMKLVNATGAQIKIVFAADMSAGCTYTVERYDLGGGFDGDPTRVTGCRYLGQFCIGKVNGQNMDSFNWYRDTGEDYILDPKLGVPIESGQKITFSNIFFRIKGSLDSGQSQKCSLNRYPFRTVGSFAIVYSDKDGYEKTATITCAGFPPKP